MHPILASELRPESGSSYPEPFASRMGGLTWRTLGDAFGLTQFGLNLETLAPGAQSALRHWHTLSDEFIFVLDGEVVLRVDEGEYAMTSGMCAGFKAGEANAHHLLNRGSVAARFLVVGSRVAGDTAFYPDDDIAWFHTEAARIAVHKDGSAYEPRPMSVG
jgi:uncharacterized cupin superfamily protein